MYVFSKMYVRVKKELVNLSLEEDVNLFEIIGKYLEFIEFY